MRHSFLTLLFTLLAVFCYAQDIIVTTDARRIEAKILEVSESEVKYKEIDNLEGPIYILSTQSIVSIIYANGNVTLFQDSSSEKEYQQETTPSLLTRLGETYTYKGHAMKGDVYANFLNDHCPSAYEIYHSGYIISYTGICLLSAAIGMELGTLIGCAIAGGNLNYSIPYMYCALGLSVASIPLLIVGYNKMHKSVDVFNQKCALDVDHRQIYWSINTNRHGVGLTLNF